MNQRKLILASLFVCFCLSLIAGMSFSAPANAASPKVFKLKFAHHNPPMGRTTKKFLNPWMRKVEEATQGKVKIIDYPAQSLAKSNQMVSAVEGGIADISWSLNGYFPGRFPLTEVMTLPFLSLPSAEKNSLILQELFEKFPAIQKEYATVKPLFLHASDPYFIATSKKTIRNLEDIKGMKLRVAGVIPSNTIKRLGATPVFLPMPGVYEAAQKGIIDGAVVPWAAVGTFKSWEVFPYWLDVNLILSTFFVIMNEDKWESLPPDVQQGIMSISGREGAAFAGRAGWGPDVREEVMAKMEKEGYKMERVVLDEGELAKWKEIAGQPIWEEWIKKMEDKGLPGKAIFDEAVSLLEKYKSN